jgi:transposase
MKKRLTTSEVAERLSVGKSTVNLWCNQGRFPNAEHVEETRGPVWYIPESDLVGFEKPQKGRPAKAAAEPAARTRSRKKAEAKP